MIPNDLHVQGFAFSKDNPQRSFYLLGDPISKEALLLNAGHDLAPLLQTIRNQKWLVKWIVLTSGDFAQVGRAAELSAKLTVPVLAQRKSLQKLARLPIKAESLGFCGVKVPQITLYLDDMPLLVLGQIQLSFTDLTRFLAAQ